MTFYFDLPGFFLMAREAAQELVREQSSSKSVMFYIGQASSIIRVAYTLRTGNTYAGGVVVCYARNMMMRKATCSPST